MLAVIFLTLVWIVLNGGISLYNIAVGIVIGTVSHFSVRHLVKTNKITGVNFIPLVLYPFFLIGQIYISGFMVIKMIIRGCRTEVVTVETELENEFLRTMLCNSITLIPGSVMLEQEDSKLTVMLIREEGAPAFTPDDDVGHIVKGKPEGMLKKVVKRGKYKEST